LAKERHEHVQGNLLCVRVITSNPEGHAVDTRTVTLHQRLERRRVMRPEAIDQGCVGEPFAPAPGENGHAGVTSGLLSCSATNPEQRGGPPRRSRNVHSRRTPSRLRNDTLDKSSPSPLPLASIGAHTRSSSSTHGPMIWPSRDRMAGSLEFSTSTILSIAAISFRDFRSCLQGKRYAGPESRRVEV